MKEMAFVMDVMIGFADIQAAGILTRTRTDFLPVRAGAPELPSTPACWLRCDDFLRWGGSRKALTTSKIPPLFDCVRRL